jgi:hypothetical protein
LKEVLDEILSSHSPCLGDGNLDRVVDEKDLEGVHEFWGKPSVYDFNNDGITNEMDEETVLQNLGTHCGPG